MEMMQGKTIHSVIEKISRSEFRRNKNELLAAHFSSFEIEELASRPEQTVAGFLAVKRALALLCESLNTDNSFSEKSFVLSHKKTGAPCIVTFPDFSAKGEKYTKRDIHISVTHNRSNVYGLAAAQEKSHG